MLSARHGRAGGRHIRRRICTLRTCGSAMLSRAAARLWARERAAGSAAPYRSWPAAAGEHGTDFGGDSARPGDDVGPAVAQRDDPVSRGGVVAVHVTPLAFGRVRKPAVGLHGDQVLAVE